MNVYCSFIQNCQNLEATKMFFNRWMDKETVVQQYNGLVSNKKKWAIAAAAAAKSLQLSHKKTQRKLDAYC